MATVDTTALAAQFKRVYGDTITELYRRQTITYNQFEESKRKASIRPGGVGYYFSLAEGDPGNPGGRGEGVLLPEPLAPEGVQGVITPRLIYSPVRMSGLALEAGKSNTEAFVATQGDITSRAYKALVEDQNRQCWGDGYGLLGTTSAAATSSAGATWDVVCDNDRGVRYFRKGMIVDFYEGATLAADAGAACRIASINPNTRTLTMAILADTYRSTHPLAAISGSSITAGAIASGAFIVRYGARLATHATTNASYEISGLNAMHDDGTLLASFEGITIASDPEFKGNILDNGGTNRPLSIDLMLAAMDMGYARSTMDSNIIRMGLGQRRKYFDLLSSDIRFAPTKLEGGYETLSFSQNAAVKILIDPMTQPNRLYFEPDGAIKKYELTPIGWGGFDANKMHWRSGYDEADLFLRTYTNLGVENRPALTVLDDLTEPVGATMPF